MIIKKKILVTGGSSGLGRSLAIKLAKYNKVFCISRSKIKEKNITSSKCNFENLQDIKKKLKKIIKTKKLDYVFLNAGLLGNIKKIDKLNSKELIKIFKVNFLANKEIIDFIIFNKIKTKLIIAISSGAALSPKFGWYMYCGSKSALKFLIESYAVEYKNIKFINLTPGLVKTKMQKQICKINEKKFFSVKKFIKLNKQNQVPSPDLVADNILNKINILKKLKSGSYIDIRKN